MQTIVSARGRAQRRVRLAVLAIAIGAVTLAACAPLKKVAPGPTTTVTFVCNAIFPIAQEYVVPDGVTRVQITAKGAQGGAGAGAPGAGGLGGSALADFAVTPGQRLSVDVGCQGGAGTLEAGGSGGASGLFGAASGGDGGDPTSPGGGGGGGGASLVRLPDGTILIEAGGGGGGGAGNGAPGGNGGAGGELANGLASTPGTCPGSGLAFGGSESAAGAGGTGCGGGDGQTGSAKTGGAGGPGLEGGGGGGGGHFGGGGGAGNDQPGAAAGGGGGSSAVGPGAVAPISAGTNAGDGSVVIRPI